MVLLFRWTIWVISFSTLKLSEHESYIFVSINKDINFIEQKDLVINKADKGNTVVIIDRTKYLEGIKFLLFDRCKFIHPPIDEDKWINYIVSLESKLKDRFKVLKTEEKNSEKGFDSICLVGTTPGILYGNPKVHKTVVNSTPKFRPIL